MFTKHIYYKDFLTTITEARKNKGRKASAEKMELPHPEAEESEVLSETELCGSLESKVRTASVAVSPAKEDAVALTRASTR